MKIDASLKRLFQRPPNLLLSQAFGEPIVVRRILSTESIVVENLHPDLLFELDNGNLIHAELHGYWMDGFACRNLIYFGLVLRDYKRPPQQVVFWVGQRSVGITDGLHYDPALHYQYRVVDVRNLDAEPLLASPNVNESIFAILCRVADARAAIVRILHQILDLPAGEQREALLQLLILSGVRGLNTVVEQEVKAMPFEIDIHENTFLEGIYQKGEHDKARSLLLRFLEMKFGPVSIEIRDRVLGADLATLDRWCSNFVAATTLDDVFG